MSRPESPVAERHVQAQGEVFFEAFGELFLVMVHRGSSKGDLAAYRSYLVVGVFGQNFIEKINTYEAIKQGIEYMAISIRSIGPNCPQ